MSAMVWTMRDVLARKRRKNPVPHDTVPPWAYVLAIFFWTAAIADRRITGPTWMLVMVGLALGLTVITLFFHLLSRRIMKELDEEPVTTRSAWRSEALDWAVKFIIFGTQLSRPIAIGGLLVSVYYWLWKPGGDAS